jgi:hypothetical protein
MFLESLVFADRAQTAMRCFLLTHQHPRGVSDLDEYQAIYAEERRTLEQRHEAYLALIQHERGHESPLEDAPLQDSSAVRPHPVSTR